MAKVMISLPDDLLRSLDAEAARRGTTRSGLIQTYAKEARVNRARQRAARVEELMIEAKPRGGNSVEELKRLRPQP